MFLVHIIGFFPGFGVQEVESFDLMLFEEDGEGSLENVYSFLEVDYVQHIVDCLLHFLSLVGLLPIWGTVEEGQNFIDELFDKIGEAEMLKNFRMKIFFPKFTLKEKPTKNNHKNKNTNNSLKNTTNKRKRIKKFKITTRIRNSFI